MNEALQIGFEPAAAERQGVVPRGVVGEAMPQQTDKLAGGRANALTH